ncbi:alpha/beta hydrolase [Nocardia sp. NBC_01503]|uniref:alpha/beta fold hydrolase n=1 Tax=Nocardia sp. NBC_01503 TaxID=2975997 RepID=UPI002E7BDB88|nr:alpha/beta fold hydrolase [Nocardia sp. NBC_01503]WTL29601.1 alpha/beta hydrolase [Nocardia sp. NBC_01503]
MRVGVRSILGFGLAAAVLAGVVTGCGGSSNERAATPRWCPSVEGHAVDCGVIQRPLIEGRAELGTVDIGYARIKHTTEGAAAGTILPNPGGPGVPMIGHAPEAAKLAAAMLDRYDVLLIDPRGTGVSSPIDCGVGADEYQLGTREEQRQAVARCARQLGAKAQGYTSAATVDDFDAVRAHLGIDKVIPYGISYGTYLMPIYAQRHPERVQSMVLTGAYPHDTDQLQRPNAQAVSLALQRICERSQVCDGNTAVNDLSAVATRLRDKPLTVQGKGQLLLTESKLASLVFEAATSNVGADPRAMTPLGMLPAALHAAVRGDDTRLIEFTRLTTDEPAYENIGLYITVVCNDYAPIWSPEADLPQREQQYRDALAQADGFGAFSAQGFAGGQRDGGDACINWSADKDHQRPDQVHTPMPDVPVLVLSGDLDAITPDANGKRVAAKFAHATFLSVPNTGHVPDLEPSGCVIGIIDHFVRTGIAAATDCVAAIPPIAVAPVTN